LPVTTKKVGELAGNSWKHTEGSGTNYGRYWNGSEGSGSVQKETEGTGSVKKHLVSTR
jgi:hypothetical protein